MSDDTTKEIASTLALQFDVIDLENRLERIGDGIAALQSKQAEMAEGIAKIKDESEVFVTYSCGWFKHQSTKYLDRGPPVKPYRVGVLYSRVVVIAYWVMRMPMAFVISFQQRST